MMTIPQAVAMLTTGEARDTGREGEAIRTVLDACLTPTGSRALELAVRAEIGVTPEEEGGPALRMPTDSQMLEWLIAGGYAPAEWRPATIEELRAGLHESNGMILVGPCSRKTIVAAMQRADKRNS